MSSLTPEQQQNIAKNQADIGQSAEARKNAEDLRLKLARDAAEAAAYPLALLQQLADFDPRSTLGNRTVSSLNSFKVWKSEFEKELAASLAADNSSSEKDSGTETDLEKSSVPAEDEEDVQA